MPKLKSPSAANEVTLADLTILFEFLSQQIKLNKQWIWKAHEEYPVHSGEGELIFIPAYDIVRRERTDQQKPGIPFDIKANQEFSGGNYATVYNVISLVVFDTHIVIKFNKERVLKRLPILGFHYTQEDLEHESAMMTKVGFFGNKKPTIIPRQSLTDHTEAFISMKKIPGKELYQVMGFEYDRHPLLLPIKMRLNMTLALLYALKRDYTDKKIIHGDFHDSNILIYFNEGVFTARAIDVAQSMDMRTEASYTDHGDPVEYYRTTALIDLIQLAGHLEAIWGGAPAVGLGALGSQKLYEMIQTLKNLEKKPIKPPISLQNLIYLFEAFLRASLSEYTQTIDLKEFEAWLNSPPVKDANDRQSIAKISVSTTIGFYKPAEEAQPAKKSKEEKLQNNLELKFD